MQDSDDPFAPAPEEAEHDSQAVKVRPNDVREFMSTKPTGDGMTRRDRVLQAIYLTAINRKDARAHLAAARTLLEFDQGKPVENANLNLRAEINAGAPDPVGDAIDHMIAEEKAKVASKN